MCSNQGVTCLPLYDATCRPLEMNSSAKLKTQPYGLALQDYKCPFAYIGGLQSCKHIIKNICEQIKMTLERFSCTSRITFDWCPGFTPQVHKGKRSTLWILTLTGRATNTAKCTLIHSQMHTHPRVFTGLHLQKQGQNLLHQNDQHNDPFCI